MEMRINVVGTSGCGKSTVAKRIAQTFKAIISTWLGFWILRKISRASVDNQTQ